MTVSPNPDGDLIVTLTRREFLAAAAAMGVAPTAGSAAGYPSQELTWLIYQAPGGTVDVSTA